MLSLVVGPLSAWAWAARSLPSDVKRFRYKIKTDEVLNTHKPRSLPSPERVVDAERLCVRAVAQPECTSGSAAVFDRGEDRIGTGSYSAWTAVPGGERGGGLREVGDGPASGWELGPSPRMARIVHRGTWGAPQVELWPNCRPQASPLSRMGRSFRKLVKSRCRRSAWRASRLSRCASSCSVVLA